MAPLGDNDKNASSISQECAYRGHLSMGSIQHTRRGVQQEVLRAK